MVNTTQFYKTKVALAVVLSLGLTACGDEEGDAGSTSTTVAETVTEAVDNTVENAQGVGSVQGTVLDTNGLPVMDATVSLAGQSVTTDASGYYFFDDVPAPSADGTNGASTEATDADTSSYLVTITGPTGYASATVSVTAQDIQVDSGNNGSSTDGSETAGEQTTWFDGFLAQADTANLPAFTASVTGVLRNCDTGAALPAGVVVALDYEELSDTGTNKTDTNVVIGVPTFTTTTGENGVYTFDALPTDSDLTLAVEGYSSATSGSTETTVTDISTTSEGIVNNLGDLSVCAITSADEIAPYIASVDGSISTSTSEGYVWEVLSQGKDGTEGLVLRFNEALDTSAVDVNNIIVTAQVDFDDLSAGEETYSSTSVLADDGLSVTITLDSALPEQTKFSVWMPRHEYTDTSSNRIVTGDASGTEQDPDGLNNSIVTDSTSSVAASVTFDSVAVGGDLTFTARDSGTTGNSISVEIVDSGNANETLLVETSGSEITITLATDGLSAISSTAQEVASAVALHLGATSLVSVSAEGTGLVDAAAETSLTGGAGSSDGTGSSEFGVSSDTVNTSQFKIEYVRTRLCTFLNVIVDPGSIDGEQKVITTVAADDDIDAVDSFWDNGGTSTISNLNGDKDTTEALLQELWDQKFTTSTQTIIVDTAVIDGNLNDATSVISDTGTVSTTSSKWKVVVEGAEHGDEVEVTPTAAFNIIGTPITITLEDKVAPTTVIQDSYNFADTFNEDHVNTVAADLGYSNGGELSTGSVSGSDGSPILYVTPRLFASDDGDDGDAEFDNRNDVFLSLVEGNTTDTDGDAYVSSTRNFVYDVNAIADWAAVTADIGVAFSEDVEVITGESVDFELSSGSTSTTLTGFASNNGLNNSDYDEGTDDQDGYHTYLQHGIIQMTTNDVVGLANLDHNAVLDYTGAVTDTQNANVALDDALVVIADAIPPFVTKAELDATTLVVTFNETVDTDTGSVVINDPDGLEVATSLDLSAATASENNTVFTWSSSTSTLPSRASFSNSSSATFTGQLDGQADFGGAGLETEVVTGEFSFAETTGGAELNHALLTFGDVEDSNGNSWNQYRGLFVDDGTTTGSTADDGIIDTQQDSDATTNGWRLALRDIPVYLATDTIAAFEVSVTLATTFDDGGLVGDEIDTEFVVTISSTHPLLTDDDQWGDEDIITGGFEESELLTNFAIIDTNQVAALGACATLNTTRTDTNDSGGLDGADLCTVDMSSVSADWNSDFTELTITFTQVDNLIETAGGYEFTKITNGESPDFSGDRLGHVVSTIVDSNGEEQSQDVQRTF